MGFLAGGGGSFQMPSIPTPQDNSMEMMQLMNQQQQQQQVMWQQRMEELRTEEMQQAEVAQEIIDSTEMEQVTLLDAIAQQEAEAQEEAFTTLVEPTPVGQDDLLIDFYGSIAQGQGESDDEEGSDDIQPL